MTTPLPQQPLGPEQILAMVLRRKWLALLLFIIPLSGAITIVMTLPDIYEATATNLVERQQVPEDFVRSTVTTQVERRLHTITQTIMSRSELSKIIDQFQLYPTLRQQKTVDEVVKHMRSAVNLKLITPGTGQRQSATAFSITYRGRDPQTVARVANHLASLYINEDLKLRERQASATTEFLETQLHQETRAKLEKLEARVRAFKEKHLGELPQQETANLATLERLNRQLLINAEKSSRIREEISSLGRQMSPEEAAESSEPDAAQAHLASLKRELSNLRKTYTEKYPDIVALRTQVDRLQRQIAVGEYRGSTDASEFTGASQVEALRSARAELRAIQSEERNLKKTLAKYQKRVENIPRREQEFHTLRRDYETTQEIYRSLLRRYEEAKLAESLEHHQKGEQFRLLDPAVIPRERAGPHRIRLLALALAGCLGMAGGTVFFLNKTDTSFHTIDDLLAFVEAPFIVSVQRIVTPEDHRAKLTRFIVGAIAAVIVTIFVVGISWWVARDNTWMTGLLS